jgi:hypothetical protein
VKQYLHALSVGIEDYDTEDGVRTAAEPIDNKPLPRVFRRINAATKHTSPGSREEVTHTAPSTDLFDFSTMPMHHAH